MQRRQFVHSVASISALSPFLNFGDWKDGSGNYKKFLPIFIAQNDKGVSSILERQQTNPDHPFFGGFPDQFDIYHPSSPAGYASPLIAAYVSPESEHHHADKIKKALEWSMDFLLKVQHEDGSIDLLTTNFNSPPDLAFGVEPLALALTILKQKEPDKLPDFQKKARQFLEKGGNSLTIGGIHTPNHRWVVCRALARIHSLFPDPKYLRRIHQWFGEGIDIDPDGQYTERSSAGYSPLVNNCFITVARLLNMPELYKPVRKNLEMTKYFVHANGEVVTDASRRQDKYTVANMSRYYYAYRYMALMDKNPIFSAMASRIEQSLGIESLSGNISYFLEYPGLAKPLPRKGILPADYEKHFPHSKLARIRRGQVDATILADNYSFLTFFKGNAALQAVRLASAFFGKGQFISPSLKIEEGKYVLIQELDGPYYQPHLKENISPDGNWEKMPRSLRPKSEIQYLKSQITIEEKQGRFSIQFDIKGTDHVPLAIELAFRPGGELTGVEEVADIDNAFILKEGFGQYQVDNHVIEFGPGTAAHTWTQLRGAKPRLNGHSVYLTGYTPFEFTLAIR